MAGVTTTYGYQQSEEAAVVEGKCSASVSYENHNFPADLVKCSVNDHEDVKSIKHQQTSVHSFKARMHNMHMTS